jgi:hypothetical protein
MPSKEENKERHDTFGGRGKRDKIFLRWEL